METLSGDKTTTKLELIHLSNSQLNEVSLPKRLFCVEGFLMSINANKLPRLSSDFSPALFYSYAVKTLNNLGDFHHTFIHGCRDMTEMSDAPLKARIELSGIGRDLIMNQHCHLNSLNYKTVTQTAMEDNNR